MLHGRLLAGLAARAVEQEPDVDPELRLARLTVGMYRFPPMVPHQVSAQVVRQGRRVGALDVSITAGGHEVAGAARCYYSPGRHPQPRRGARPSGTSPVPMSCPR